MLCKQLKSCTDYDSYYDSRFGKLATGAGVKISLSNFTPSVNILPPLSFDISMEDENYQRGRKGFLFIIWKKENEHPSCQTSDVSLLSLSRRGQGWGYGL